MLREKSRVYDIPNRTIRITAEDDLGAVQEIHIAVSRDNCPMCATPYMKTSMGVVDVDATLAAVAAAYDQAIDPAIASFEAAGADITAINTARAARAEKA